MSNKFRASYSVLSQWAKGDYDRAISIYFKLDPFFDTPAMKAGREYHKKWEDEVKETGCMPEIFGGRKLVAPQTEIKLVKEIDQWLDLVGIIDLKDEGLLVDYKTGKSPSSAFTSSYQANLYQILFPDSTRFEFHHYDQYKDKTDMSIIHLTEKTLDDGINWLITHAGEMHSYLQENGLYERYGK